MCSAAVARIWSPVGRACKPLPLLEPVVAVAAVEAVDPVDAVEPVEPVTGVAGVGPAVPVARVDGVGPVARVRRVDRVEAVAPVRLLLGARLLLRFFLTAILQSLVFYYMDRSDRQRCVRGSWPVAASAPRLPSCTWLRSRHRQTRRPIGGRRCPSQRICPAWYCAE